MSAGRDGYPSDLTDEQWALIEPLLPAPRTGRKGGRREKHPRRRIVDAILYLARTGCQWRYLPGPPGSCRNRPGPDPVPPGTPYRPRTAEPTRPSGNRAAVGRQDPLPQQVEAGPPRHLALGHSDPVDPAFDDAPASTAVSVPR